MKQLFIIFLIFLSIPSSFAYSDDFWGQTGHRVVGEIAFQHLTKRAKRNLEKLLNKEGLALISTYADEIKSDRQFNQFGPWHYVNWKDDETYETSKKNKRGDLIVAIQQCRDMIKDRNSNEKARLFYLKMLVHLIGDLHQPLHIGRAKDRGGNDIRVKWFGSRSNLHAVWDTKMIESYNMTYSELSNNLNKFTKDEIREIQSGTVKDWVDETRLITQKVYKSAELNQNLGYRYMYDYFDTVKFQLQKGGLRLAKVLNELFG